ncbi:hypothetical protein PHET_11221 [Paragonimus heterotremus]|uniref:Uncharacterized protein n=1 Tax=Paragonimus heterotremus TaxID=100268 RepID=A0A8J4WSF1_9TREM|nr:hypothetical protein PHET_11221 [Paragonimus heterotremus]
MIKVQASDCGTYANIGLMNAGQLARRGASHPGDFPAGSPIPTVHKEMVKAVFKAFRNSSHPGVRPSGKFTFRRFVWLSTNGVVGSSMDRDS